MHEKPPDHNSRTIVKKDESRIADLAAMTAKTGVEYAIFIKGGKCLRIRRNERSVGITWKIQDDLQIKL